MSKVVVFINDKGTASVVYPTPEAIELYGLEAVALKDVPAGKPFKIIDVSEVPEGDWTIDPATLTDGVGGNFTSFE